MSFAFGDMLPTELVFFGVFLLGSCSMYFFKLGDHDVLDVKFIAEEFVFRVMGYILMICQLIGVVCFFYFHLWVSVEVWVGDIRCGIFGFLYFDVVDRWDGYAFAVVELLVDVVVTIGRKIFWVVFLFDMLVIKRDFVVVVYDD